VKSAVQVAFRAKSLGLEKGKSCRAMLPPSAALQAHRRLCRVWVLLGDMGGAIQRGVANQDLSEIDRATAKAQEAEALIKQLPAALGVAQAQVP